jgi:hypothetical protein
MVFQSEHRTLMNQVTDLLKSIDEMVWLKAALAGAPADRPLVYDSMRFTCDYNILRDRGFTVWAVATRDDLRHARLQARGQEYTAEIDETHSLEVELLQHEHDALLTNDDDISTRSLQKRVGELLGVNLADP